jgi:hypothetical protein
LQSPKFHDRIKIHVLGEITDWLQETPVLIRLTFYLIVLREAESVERLI